MIQRGRKSTAKLAVVTTLPVTKRPRLPGAPKAFTPAQAAVWKSVVATKPADWFTADSWPLLAQYCRHVVTADMLQRKIDASETLDDMGVDTPVAEYQARLKMRDSESKIINALARSMRLTQQARLKAETAASKHGRVGDGARKPWQA